MSKQVDDYLHARNMLVAELFRNAWVWDHYGRDPSTAENYAIITAAKRYRTQADRPVPANVPPYLEATGPKKPPAPLVVRRIGEF